MHFTELIDLVSANVWREGPDRVRVTVDQATCRQAARLDPYIDDDDEHPHRHLAE